jgi:hypothetical protein
MTHSLKKEQIFLITQAECTGRLSCVNSNIGNVKLSEGKNYYFNSSQACGGCSQNIIFDCLNNSNYRICNQDMGGYIRLYFNSPVFSVNQTPYLDVYFNDGNIREVITKEFLPIDVGRLQVTVPTPNPNNNITAYYEDNYLETDYNRKIKYNIYINNKEVNLNITTARDGWGFVPPSIHNLFLKNIHKVKTTDNKKLKKANTDKYYDKYKTVS